MGRFPAISPRRIGTTATAALYRRQLEHVGNGADIVSGRLPFICLPISSLFGR